MYTKQETGEGIIAYHVMDLTPLEMHELCVMRKRIYQVLESHQKKDSKKEYLSDDELITLASMFGTLTSGCAALEESSFSKHRKHVVDALKDLKRSTPHPLSEDADLFGGSEDE